MDGRQILPNVIIGAGGIFEWGWLSLEESDLDITKVEQWGRWFAPSSLTALMAEHVWEHLTPKEGEAAARNCFAFLRSGGMLRIAVPDGFHFSPCYITWVSPVIGYNGDDHKVLYNYRTLTAMLERVGFRVVLREWFDENRNFHTAGVDPVLGRIQRTFDSLYSRFLLSPVVGAPYTSLIVDAFKP